MRQAQENSAYWYDTQVPGSSPHRGTAKGVGPSRTCTPRPGRSFPNLPLWIHPRRCWGMPATRAVPTPSQPCLKNVNDLLVRANTHPAQR